MPVISVKALASVLASYSCVVIVSETTRTSMFWKGFAALTNHSISLSCCSFVSVEGWNSVSTQRRASSMPAKAVPVPSARATALALISHLICDLGLIERLPKLRPSSGGLVDPRGRPGCEALKSSHVAEHQCGIDKRNGHRPPETRPDEADPREMNESSAQQRDEQPIAARSRKAQH